MFIRMLAFNEAYVKPAIRSFKEDCEGATAIEYGLIAGGISLAIVTAIFAFGGSLSSLFSTLATKMASANSKVN